MLVNAIEFISTGGDGKSTVLSLVEKNAFTLSLEEPVNDKVGEDFA